MKKRLLVALLIGLFLLFSLVQAQSYSEFNRFTDNIKMFFSGNKVQLALEIREKEVNSAIENINQEKNQEAVKNLEKARRWRRDSISLYLKI